MFDLVPAGDPRCIGAVLEEEPFAELSEEASIHRVAAEHRDSEAFAVRRGDEAGLAPALDRIELRVGDVDAEIPDGRADLIDGRGSPRRPHHEVHRRGDTPRNEQATEDLRGQTLDQEHGRDERDPDAPQHPTPCHHRQVGQRHQNHRRGHGERQRREVGRVGVESGSPERDRIGHVHRRLEPQGHHQGQDRTERQTGRHPPPANDDGRPQDDRGHAEEPTPIEDLGQPPDLAGHVGEHLVDVRLELARGRGPRRGERHPDDRAHQPDHVARTPPDGSVGDEGEHLRRPLTPDGCRQDRTRWRDPERCLLKVRSPARLFPFPSPGSNDSLGLRCPHDPLRASRSPTSPIRVSVPTTCSSRCRPSR